MRKRGAIGVVAGLGMALTATSACTQLLGIGELGISEPATPAHDAEIDAQEADRRAVDTGNDAPPLVADAGAELDAPPRAIRMFVTTARFRGNMGGLAGADAKCSEAASKKPLGGSWRAWTSAGGYDAIARVPEGRFVRLDGTTIASSRTKLAGGVLEAPIDRTELNVPAEGDPKVWTGSFADGTLQANCSEWSSADGVLSGVLGTTGEWTAASSRWIDDRGQPGLPARARDYEARLYCFER